MIAFFPDGSIQQNENICSCKRCLKGLFVDCMFKKGCKEATEVIVSENPEADLDEEKFYEFEEDQLPHGTIYDMVQMFVALHSFSNSSELFYVCKVLKCGIAEDNMLDNSGHSIKKGQKYLECYYLEKVKEVQSAV